MPANTCKVTDLQFAFSCINHNSGGTIDFQKVADECGMSSRSAACTKLGRMKRAQSLSPGDDKGSAPPDDEGTPVVDDKPKKAKKAKKAVVKKGASKKRKADEREQDTEPGVKVEEDLDGVFD